MARYLARPSIATDSPGPAARRSSGTAAQAALRDGTVAFRYTPHELLERLVALVPRPRRHLTRYHEVLAPAFAGRSEIVPPLSDGRPPPDHQPPPLAPSRPNGPMGLGEVVAVPALFAASRGLQIASFLGVRAGIPYRPTSGDLSDLVVCTDSRTSHTPTRAPPQGITPRRC
jgi:hypothetical protein